MFPYLKLLVWSVMLSMFRVLAEDTFFDSSFGNLTDLKTSCRYTPLCRQSDLSNVPDSNLRYTPPCCQTCSCHPDCGLHGNCCFGTLDDLSTDSSTGATCRAPYEIYSQGDELFDSRRYRMINKCNGFHRVPQNFCLRGFGPDTTEAFHPRISNSTGLIYINRVCALCNDEIDTVPWLRTVTCTATTNVSLTTILENALHNRSNNTSKRSACRVYFIPPPGFQISTSQLCSSYLIHSCYKENLEYANKYQNLCRTYNVSYSLYLGGLRPLYTNAFCALCNFTGETNLEYVCPRNSYLSNSNFPSKFELTVVLDTAIPTDSVSDDKAECSEGSVLVKSFSNVCREVKCPWGQLRVNGSCDYYSSLWVGGPFSVMLRLVPKNTSTFLPKDFIENVAFNNRDDEIATWIKRKTLKKWRLLVFYHLYLDTSLIEYLVVKATYTLSSVDPVQLRKMVYRSLNDVWEIDFIGSSYKFTVTLNEYSNYGTIYDSEFELYGINSNARFVALPRWDLCSGKHLGNHDEMVVPVADYIDQEPVGNSVSITKMLFCDQIDLLPDEYEYDLTCQKVFFKVTQRILTTFNVLEPNIPENQSSSRTNLTYKPQIRVCLHEFPQRLTNNTCTRSVCMLIFLFCLMLKLL